MSGITLLGSALLRLPSSCWVEEGGHDVRNPVQVIFTLVFINLIFLGVLTSDFYEVEVKMNEG